MGSGIQLSVLSQGPQCHVGSRARNLDERDDQVEQKGAVSVCAQRNVQVICSNAITRLSLVFIFDVARLYKRRRVTLGVVSLQVTPPIGRPTPCPSLRTCAPSSSRRRSRSARPPSSLPATPTLTPPARGRCRRRRCRLTSGRCAVAAPPRRSPAPPSFRETPTTQVRLAFV